MLFIKAKTLQSSALSRIRNSCQALDFHCNPPASLTYLLLNIRKDPSQESNGKIVSEQEKWAQFSNQISFLCWAGSCWNGSGSMPEVVNWWGAFFPTLLGFLCSYEQMTVLWREMKSWNFVFCFSSYETVLFCPALIWQIYQCHFVSCTVQDINRIIILRCTIDH